jgi:hypothetical protein
MTQRTNFSSCSLEWTYGIPVVSRALIFFDGIQPWHRVASCKSRRTSMGQAGSSNDFRTSGMIAFRRAGLRQEKAPAIKGDVVPREAARGLMWLVVAQDSANSDERWINDLYDAAFKQANNDERAQALAYLERWLKTRRD